MRLLDTLLTRLEDVLHAFGCIALALICVLVNVDIFSRLLLDSPLQIQFEAIELFLMPALSMLSLSWVLRRGRHLSLEILDPARYGKAWPILNRLWLSFAFVFFALVTWKSGEFALNALERGQAYLGIIDWPIGWALAVVPLATLVLCLRILLEITRSGGAESISH